MSTQRAAAPIPTFPVLEGRSLLGERVALPAGLPAERTLVLVAFQRWQQPVVDGWISRAVAGGRAVHAARRRRRPMPVAVVELAVLSVGWKPARRFIEGGMVAASRDPDVLARTITVYTDVSAFRRAAAASRPPRRCTPWSSIARARWWPGPAARSTRRRGPPSPSG